MPGDGRAAKMCRKEQATGQEKQAGEQHYLVCQVCGRKVKSAECSWQEDDDAKIICQDCKAERESCGCSD